MTEKLEIPVWDSAYRVISSSFPPITLFEDILDPAELQMSYALESLTNDRLAEEVGLISRVAPEDRVSGHGSTPVMAAFTHIGKVSRFTDGTFGIYYAASSQSAAIAAAGEEKRPNRPETGRLARLSDMRKSGERKRNIRQDWCQRQREKGPKAA